MPTPLVYLNFENDTATEAINDGIEQNGTFLGTPVYGDISELTDRNGNALLIDSANSVSDIIFPSSINYDFTSFSVTGFIKSNVGLDSNYIMLQQAHNTNDANHSGYRTGWRCYYSGTHLNFDIYTSGDGRSLYNTAISDTLKINGFHYAFTYNYETGNLILYVNGAYLQTLDAKTLIPDSLHRFAIGGEFNGDNFITLEQKQILSDELYLFDSVLTLRDVKTLYRETKMRIIAKTTINARIVGTSKNKIISSANIMSLIGLVNASMNYRLDKGIALTDEEIERNFTFSKILETPTPIIKDNAIVNHISNTLYFGDLTVNDTDGTFTGSGKVTALRNGYAMSQEATA